jgi:hypothetical protein
VAKGLNCTADAIFHLTRERADGIESLLRLALGDCSFIANALCSSIGSGKNLIGLGAHPVKHLHRTLARLCINLIRFFAGRNSYCGSFILGRSNYARCLFVSSLVNCNSALSGITQNLFHHTANAASFSVDVRLPVGPVSDLLSGTANVVLQDAALGTDCCEFGGQRLNALRVLVQNRIDHCPVVSECAAANLWACGLIHPLVDAQSVRFCNL